MQKKQLIIGSRGSDLALWQAHHVADRLSECYPELMVAIEIITTTGDKVADTSLSIIGGKGAFTKEIETSLLDGNTDIAVHSLKDLPTALPDGLMLGAIPERARVEDVFLSNDPNARLMHLPDGATIATGSIRRKAQLLTRRPDFNIIDIRGNVPTRIRKLRESNWDGMILASAGLHRLDLTERIAHEIPLEWILPAVGQGALAIECRTGDLEVQELLAPLDHAATRAAVTAERALLATLEGGCQVPIGAYGRLSEETLELTACIAALDGASVIRAEHSGPVHAAKQIGEELARTLLASGGEAIMAAFAKEAGWLASDRTQFNDHPEA